MAVPIKRWEGACAWRSADLTRDESWIYHFTGSDLAELDAALNEAKRRGAAIPGLGKSDFPLPKLNRKLAELLEELESGRGVALFRGLDLKRYTRKDAATIVWGLG